MGKIKIGIVDECSQLNDKGGLRDDLNYGDNKDLSNFIKYFGIGTDLNYKLIFLGDGAQINPIGMDFAPALSKSYLEEHFNLKVQKIKLTKIYRQESKEIIDLASTFIKENCHE